MRRAVEMPAGGWLDRGSGGGGELWFVISGSGLLALDQGVSLELRPDRGIWLPSGVEYRACSLDDDLLCDLVTLPPGGAASSGPPVTSDFADRPVEITGDRQFRVVLGPALGCPGATQFVGEIPPGRAPDHRHPYDETVLVLAGQGMLHLDGQTQPLTPGTCTHLPPGVPHCLENTGSVVLRVLGVFHPADTPAAKLPA